MAPTSKGSERRSSTRIRVAEARRRSSRSDVSSRTIRAARRHGTEAQHTAASTSAQPAASVSDAVESYSDDDSSDEIDDDFVPDAAPHSRRTPLKRPAAGPASSTESPDPLTVTPSAKRARRSSRLQLTPVNNRPGDASNAGLPGSASRQRQRDSHAAAIPRGSRHRARDRSSSNRANKGKSASTPKRARRALGSKRKKTTRHSGNNAGPLFDENAIIPPWKELPYFNLINIFRAAADQFEEPARMKWLIGTSLVCRDFCEPALTVLYQSPPLLTRLMADRFVELLSQDPDSTRFNYRQKVEKLRIDVPGIAKPLLQGQVFDLPTLIRLVPRLQVLDFHHDLDLPPFRSLDEGFKWAYPEALFDALGAVPNPDATKADELPDLGAMKDPLQPEAEPAVSTKHQVTKLTGWRWNRRMMGSDLDLGKIRDLHLTPSFAGLKRIGFLNYQVPSIGTKRLDAASEARDKLYIDEFASAINALPALEFLTIESSTVVNGDLLALLPRTLQTLQLVNCWDVNSRDFADYLLSHGGQLRHLHLLHNQSLNLAFLTVLGEACPKLQTLSMDFMYYRHHTFYNDSDPNYDEILTKEQIPVWPASIESIELSNMRKWTADAAEMFFKSLVDSAPNLPSLRHLDLKAMLDIPIRQRSQIRDKWTAELRKTFLRKWKPPMPFYSLQNLPKKAQKPSPTKEQTIAPTSSEEGRRSGRIATTDRKSEASARAGSDSRGLRNRSGQTSYAEPDTSDSDLSEPDDEVPPDSPLSETETTISTDDGFVQGLCDVVNVKLDNQKPTEQTWSMNDFLDSESDDPSDDDWEVTGDRDVNDEHYAW